VTNRFGGDTVPLTVSGDTEATCSVMTGSTASKATSDTAAGTGRCSARTSVFSTGASVAVQVPSAAVVAVATVVGAPNVGPRRPTSCSSMGAPAADAPPGNANLPDSVTVPPGVSSCGSAVSVSLADAPASLATRGRTDGSLAYSAAPGQAV
jgi:hypothetical protein